MEVYVLNELEKSGGRHFCKIVDKGRFDNFNYVVSAPGQLNAADLWICLGYDFCWQIARRSSTSCAGKEVFNWYGSRTRSSMFGKDV